MNEQVLSVMDAFSHPEGLNTVADKSYVFGAIEPETVAPPYKQPLVQSAVVAFDAVKPLLSGKPIRNPKRLREELRNCSVYLVPEDSGGFSVISADLPGVVGQGETEEEALANIREAYSIVIRTYKEFGESVPWLSTPEEPEPGSITRSVIVHG